ncbi:hypothetical protein NDU88_003333 [Pleurodeles waltl]|uniref:Uncharacterized protein n=1 Tax=Pleurodeles waltl TaxID=8319 RepID=A0AAV7Q9H7_PLEWA|nr:hypothetical protein NDU88_003333 [Pleurodeles waltl]
MLTSMEQSTVSATTEAFVVADFLSDVNRVDVEEWHFFVTGSMMDDFFDAFLPWGVVDGKGLCFLLTDVIVIDDNSDGVIIMGEGGAVTVAVAVVVVGDQSCC